MHVYNKVIVAIAGLAVMLAARYGIDLSGAEQAIVDVLVAVATAFGVYQVKNSTEGAI